MLGPLLCLCHINDLPDRVNSLVKFFADEHLFHKMVYNKDHCIHQLLPPEKILPMKRRVTNCIFALPQCHYNLYKRSFVLRYLFGHAYYILHIDLL